MQVGKEQVNLTRGNIWRVMISFALPIFLGTLFQSFYSLADAVIIGKFAGKEALASIEAVYTIVGIPLRFFIGVSTGATILISQLYGAKKKKEISRMSHTVMAFSFYGSIILMVACILLCNFALKLIKVPEEIFFEARNYTLIIFTGMLGSLTYNIGAGIFRALGDSKTPFHFIIFANFINILLDLLFVAVFKLGVLGAGVATILSQYICAFLMVRSMFKTNLECKLTRGHFKIHKKEFLEFTRLGLPIGAQGVLFPISNTIVQASINNFGVNAISAWSVCGKLDFLVWYVPEAISVAVSTFVGQNIGAKQWKRAKRGVGVGILISVMVVGLVSAILFAFRNTIASLVISDPAVIRLSGQILSFIAPMYFLYSLVEILPGAIRGTGDTFVAMLITLIGTCLFRVLWVLFVVPKKNTFFWVLYCYPMSWILTSVIFILYFHLLFRKKADL